MRNIKTLIPDKKLKQNIERCKKDRIARKKKERTKERIKNGKNLNIIKLYLNFLIFYFYQLIFLITLTPFGIFGIIKSSSVTAFMPKISIVLIFKGKLKYL